MFINLPPYTGDPIQRDHIQRCNWFKNCCVLLIIRSLIIIVKKKKKKKFNQMYIRGILTTGNFGFQAVQTRV